jgi:hypothetical protein
MEPRVNVSTSFALAAFVVMFALTQCEPLEGTIGDAIVKALAAEKEGK